MKIIFADFRLLPRLLWSAFVKQEKWSNIMRNIYHHYSWSDKVKTSSWNFFINNKMNKTRRSWFIFKITADHGKSAIEKEKENWLLLETEWKTFPPTILTCIMTMCCEWGWSFLVLGRLESFTNRCPTTALHSALGAEQEKIISVEKRLSSWMYDS